MDAAARHTELISRDRRSLILDQSMPKMSGEECLVEIRRMRRDVPFLMCSGYAIPTDSAGLLDDDLVEFVRKPYDVEDLIRRIEGLVAAAR